MEFISKLKSALVLLVLIICAFSCWVLIYKFSRFSLPWSAGGLKVLFIALFSSSFVYVVQRKRLKNPFPAYFGLLLLLSAVCNALWPLVCVTGFFAASFLLGQSVLNKIKISSNDSVVYFLIGAGVVGLVVSVLARFKINSSGVYLGILVSYLFFNFQKIRAILMVFSSQERQFDSKIFYIFSILLIYLLLGLLPEIGYDALAFHLFVASQVATLGYWSFDPSLYALALLPMHGDWLYTVGYLLAGEEAARLINILFIFIMAKMCFDITYSFCQKTSFSIVAALIFITMPITYNEAGSLFVESVWGAYLVAGLFLLYKTSSEDQREAFAKKIILASILLGFAAETKAITFPIIAVAAIIFLFNPKVYRNIKWCFFAALIFLMLASVPYIQAYLISKNPVFPFFNEYFQSPFFPASNFNNTLFNSRLTWSSLFDLTFFADKYIEGSFGAAGFCWYLLLPAALLNALILKNKNILLVILFCILAIGAVFLSQSYLRYIFPVLMILVAAICASLALVNFKSFKWGNYCIWCAMSCALFLDFLYLPSATANHRNYPIEILFGSSIKKELYVKKILPINRAIDIINNVNTNKNATGFFSSQIFAAGLRSVALYPTWYNYKFSGEIGGIATDQDFLKVAKTYDMKYLILADDWVLNRNLIIANSRLIVKLDKLELREVEVISY